MIETATATSVRLTMNKRDDLLQIISDMGKEINGVRPSLSRYSAMSNTELEAEIQKLQPMVEETIEHEKMIDAKCITLFNDEIATFLQQGAANRTTAIRWMLQAQGYDESPENADYICFNNGINPYIPSGKEIFEEVEAAIATL